MVRLDMSGFDSRADPPNTSSRRRPPRAVEVRAAVSMRASTARATWPMHTALRRRRAKAHGEKGVRRFRTTSQTQLAPLHLAAAQIRRACADISAKAGESTGAQKE